MKKKTLILLGVILFITTITRCNSNESRKEIEARFEGFVSLCPTNNLMDFYDKEGKRNEEFEEEDQGTWIVRTSIDRNQNNGVDTEGMLLRFNKNTRQATGHYFISTFSKKYGNTKIEYPVYYNESGIHLMEYIEDEELKDKILNFKFLVEYVSMENDYLSSLAIIDKRFNPELPLYRITYQLTKEDENIKNIKNHFNINQNFEQLPKLRFEGTGEGGWLPRNDRVIEFMFDEERSVYLTSSISFSQSEGMRE